LLLGTASLGAGTLALNFLNAPPPATGLQVGSFFAGDFNGDGNLDLAVEDQTADTLTVLLGNGDGKFTVGPVTPFKASVGAIGVVGDFNHDGNLDIAFVHGQVTVLFGDGTGKFNAVTPSSSILGTPTGIAAGDFNGDGILDLVVITPDSPPLYGGITTLLGKGDGTFTALAPAYPQVGPYPGAVAAGDFKGNGTLDLAVTSLNLATVTIMPGNGNGTFGSNQSIATGLVPGSIVAGDFTGSGMLDLAVTNFTSDTVTVLLGDGAGNFTATAASPLTGKSPSGISVADFNGDGIPDLVVTNSGDNTLSILLGNGDGTFTTGAAPPQAGAGPGSPVAGDFNGDGIVDLAVLNSGDHSISILLTQLTQTATATINGVSPLGTGTHQVVASYQENGSFAGSTSAATGLTAQQATPKVQVVPSSSNITTGQQLQVTIAVSGAGLDPTPTGSVTLSGGGYTSAALTLSSGGATINISAGALAAGTDTLTAVYTPDAGSASIYGGATGSSPVTVSVAIPPTFAMTGTAVTVTAGATGANTSIITVSPSGGFTGSVALTASITASPAGAVNPPTLSFGSTTPVTISGTSSGTATLTISTTANQQQQCSASNNNPGGIPWYAKGGAVLACLLLFGIPARRRRWPSILGMGALFVGLTSAVLACGGHNTVCSNVIIAGTTAGNYTITVSGTSGATVAGTTINLAVQ